MDLSLAGGSAGAPWRGMAWLAVLLVAQLTLLADVIYLLTLA